MGVSLVRWFRTHWNSTTSLLSTDAQPPGKPAAPVDWLGLFPSEDTPTEVRAAPAPVRAPAPAVPIRRDVLRLAAGLTVALLLLASLATLGDITGERTGSSADSAANGDAPLAARVVPAAAVALPPAIGSAPPVRKANVVGEALVRRDRLAIQGALNRYRDAMSTLDVAGVRSVWPGVGLEALRSGFSRLAEQNVEFESCHVSPAASHATATCVGVVESGFRTGHRRPHVTKTRWQFRLQKTGGGWMITAIDTEPA